MPTFSRMTPAQRAEFGKELGLIVNTIDPTSPEGRVIQERLKELRYDAARARAQWAEGHGIPNQWLMQGPGEAIDLFCAKVEANILWGLSRPRDQIVSEVCEALALPRPREFVELMPKASPI